MLACFDDGHEDSGDGEEVNDDAADDDYNVDDNNATSCCPGIAV